jgi:hypothetical protein
MCLYGRVGCVQGPCCPAVLVLDRVCWPCLPSVHSHSRVCRLATSRSPKQSASCQHGACCSGACHLRCPHQRAAMIMLRSGVTTKLAGGSVLCRVGTDWPHLFLRGRRFACSPLAALLQASCCSGASQAQADAPLAACAACSQLLRRAPRALPAFWQHLGCAFCAGVGRRACMRAGARQQLRGLPCNAPSRRAIACIVAGYIPTTARIIVLRGTSEKAGHRQRPGCGDSP